MSVTDTARRPTMLHNTRQLQLASVAREFDPEVEVTIQIDS